MRGIQKDFPLFAEAGRDFPEWPLKK